MFVLSCFVLSYNPYGSDSEESDEDEELTQHKPVWKNALLV